MDTFKKIDRDFLLTNSSVNTYGYRLLTSGYLMDEYKKNPIGYYMHGTEEFPREQGVLVKWEDLKVVGDNVYGKPCINLSHPRGERTVREVESGFLNAASFGHFVVLGISSDPADYLEGQEGPTVNKWFNRECSLVDLPGNYDALKNELFDENNNPLKLENLKTNFQNMKQIFFTAEQLATMNLKADADSVAVATAFNALVAKAAKADGLVQDLATANGAKKTAEDALTALKADTVTGEVDSILEKALNVDKKITKEVSTQLKADYATNPTGLKALVANMPNFMSITDKVKLDSSKAKDLADKTWAELDKEGKLEDLKAADFDLFKTKYKDQFGSDYNGK